MGRDGLEEEFDLFLSHATPDKEWVLTLAERLRELGLRVFVDSREIKVGDNFVLRLSDGLENCRYMALVLSTHTDGRPWVLQEWTSFMASQGPLGRLLPVKIDAVELPTILKATQALDAVDRDASQAAGELFKVVGDPSTLDANDARRLVLGRDLVFSLSRDEDELTVTCPDGTDRSQPVPWKATPGFGVSYMEFGKLQRQPVVQASDRGDLYRHARVLGGALFDTLFDSEGRGLLAPLLTPDRARPVIQIRTDDDLLLSLPWELLYDGAQFLMREGTVDLVRTTPTAAAGETLLKEPKEPFKLVVNVSAPDDSHLSYEAESYRITLATAERCIMVPTELGSLEDLVSTVVSEAPTGIHFSGHGRPGALLFENDRGYDDSVEVSEVIKLLRQRLPSERRIPPFFYLASCHGNDPSAADDDDPGAISSALQLHKAGVTEVVGYFGPIVDELSTRAEEALYEGIASGHTTRDAVRFARERISRPFHQPDARHRPGATRAEKATLEEDTLGTSTVDAPASEADNATDTHPFAWAQLVFYRRGPEWPLSVPAPAGKRTIARKLTRKFQGFGDRKILKAGFVGRRLEQHKIRRRLRDGRRVLVLQGLGGLGKSTLAQRVLPWLTEDETKVCTLWCQETVDEEDQAEALVAQLLQYCRGRFGLGWEGVVQQVDQIAGDNSAKRFVFFLQALIENSPGQVLYFDNLESLLVGPEDTDDAQVFGEWADPALETIWQTADQIASQTQELYLIASCRYRNSSFSAALLPVTPLPADAMFRLTEWFPALQRLAPQTRALLVSKLDGHPRAVEYANDLVSDALARWRDTRGEWTLSVPPTSEEVQQEWQELVGPCLPEVDDKIQDNLLLESLWSQVLDERARRFLFRMILLRRPAEWDLLQLLGEPDETAAESRATAERLRNTSLIEQLEHLISVEDEVRRVTRYTLHPSTRRFVVHVFVDDDDLRLPCHLRLGEHLDATARETPYIETIIEAGHHLFEAGEIDRASELLVLASSFLQTRGRIREGLRVLEPLLKEAVTASLNQNQLGRLLGTAGTSFHHLGEVQKAIDFYKQQLTIARKIGDRRAGGNALGNLGNAYSYLGEPQKARGFYEQQLAIAREIGDRRGEGTALGNLGIAYSKLGEVQKAIDFYEQQLLIVRQIGDRQGEGNALGNLGLAYSSLGEFPKAISFHKQALVISREIGSRQAEGDDLGNLGIAYALLGEVPKAMDLYEKQLKIALEIGDRRGEGTAFRNLGLAYSHLGEVPKAIGFLEKALAISREVGDRRGEGVADRALKELQ